MLHVQDGVVTWEEFQSAYTTNPQLIRVFAKLFGVDNAVDPAKEKYMSGPVFTITKAIASEQAAAFENARKCVMCQRTRCPPPHASMHLARRCDCRGITDGPAAE